MVSPDSFASDLMNAITESEIDCECPNCGKDITFSLSDVGSSVTCPHCGEEIALEAE